MIENGKNRHTVWLTVEAWNMVGGEYKSDGSSTQNEYIEKAIRFYTSYCKADRNERYLTDAISGVLETRLGALGNRIGKLLFEMVVEESMMMHLLAMDESLTFSDLEHLRKWAIQIVRKTDGGLMISSKSSSKCMQVVSNVCAVLYTQGSWYAKPVQAY